MKKRKTLLINPSFQFNFIAYCGLTFLMASLAFYAATMIFLNQLEEFGASLNLSENHIFWKVLEVHHHNLNYLFFVTAIILFFIQLIIGMFYSNKIAGPIYRLTREVKNAKSFNDLPIISAREGDLFEELYEAINEKVMEQESKPKDD